MKRLVYDEISGRYMYIDTEELKNNVDKINRLFLNRGYITLRDIESFLGEPHSHIILHFYLTKSIVNIVELRQYKIKDKTIFVLKINKNIKSGLY